MEINEILPHLQYEFSSEIELIKAIEEISLKFTKKREQIADYTQSEKLIAAYVCFYLMTNLPKLSASLEKLKLDLNQFKDFEIFDIGSGPGTFSIAMLKENPELNISLIEKSPVMLQQARKLISGLFSDATVSFYAADEKFPKKEKTRVGVFGHSVNEMGEEIFLDYVKRLALDHIILIEPGTKEFFQLALSLRERLKKKYNILYPCFSTEACPLSQKDWCHQYLSVSHDISVERLSQMAKKDRRNLPISLWHYEKRALSELKENESTRPYRIIRVYRPTKFSVEWQVCSVEDEANIVIDVQIMNRGYNKKQIKQLQRFEAGDEISLSLEKELEEKKWRATIHDSISSREY